MNTVEFIIQICLLIILVSNTISYKIFRDKLIDIMIEIDEIKKSLYELDNFDINYDDFSE